jgi:DNA polymerase III alpha subunit
MNNVGDIDIDFPDRNLALSLIKHTPASIIRNGKIDKHNTGVYFHDVPIDPLTGYCSIHYEAAGEVGLYKFDLLNVGVYEQIRNEDHLISLMNKELNWELLEYPELTSQLIHIGNHTDLVSRLKPKCVSDLAMVLALIRPGKRHLVAKCERRGFKSICDEIWQEDHQSGYSFKHAHAVGYAVLVKVHANLIIDALET